MLEAGAAGVMGRRHSERSEESCQPMREILRFAQDDKLRACAIAYSTHSNTMTQSSDLICSGFAIVEPA
jgi:hypothetical protein